MGGSGGGYFPNDVTSEDLIRRIRQAEDRSRDDTFETSVGRHLSSLLAGFNDRDVERTQVFFDQVTAALEDDIDGTITLLFGGSISKHTYVDGISDVDALVLLNDTELADESPNAVKSFLADRLRRQYGADAIHEGTLAVTVTVDDTAIQLLPALRRGERFAIARDNGRNWSQIDPDKFAKALTKANRRVGGKLVPCIKLIKSIISSLPRDRQLSGYHTEAVAIRVFRRYDGPKTLKSMLRYFFENAPSQVATPIKDSSGQSVNVDQYLGPANSVERRVVAHTLSRIARRIRNADGALSLDRWKEIVD